jgi:hypothetical protein
MGPYLRAEGHDGDYTAAVDCMERLRYGYCYDLNRRAIVNLRDCLECSRIHRDGNVLGVPPKNLRIEGVEAINRGNQRRMGDFLRPFAGGVVSAWGESRGQ